MPNVYVSSNAIKIAAVVSTCICVVLGTINSIFTLMAFAIGVVLMLAYSEEEYVPILFFVLPFAPIFKISYTGTSFFTYLTLLYVFLHFVRNKWRMTDNDVLILILTMYVIGCECIAQTINVVRTIKFMNNLLLLSILTDIKLIKQHRTIILSYIIGFVSSGLVGAFGSDFFPIANFVATKVEYFPGGEIIERFAGLYNDPNYFSINIIISFCLIVNLNYRKELSDSVSLLLAVILVYFVAKTSSKSALIMMSLPLCLYIRNCVKAGRVFWGVLVCGAIAVCIYLVQVGEISIFENVISRLTAVQDDGIERVTSGRTAIWEQYLGYFSSFPIKTFFGNGVGIFYLNERASHNTYMDLIYQLGIVGTILYISILGINMRRVRQLIVRNLNNYGVLISIIVMYAFLSQLQEFDLPFQLSLSVLILNLDFKPEKRKGNRC